VNGLQAALVAVGILAILSGGLKFRESVRNRGGTTPGALGELAVGAAALLLGSRVGPGGGVAVLGLTLLVIVGSTLHQFHLSREAQLRRERTESARLRAFLSTKGPTS
jgi:hypothetical protein